MTVNNGKFGSYGVANPVGGPGAYDAGVLEFFTGIHSELDFTNEDANLVLTDNGAPIGGGVTFPIAFTGALATDVMESSKVTGDAFNRYERWADGSEHFGDGTGAASTVLKPSDPNAWGTGLTLLDTDGTGLVVGDPAGTSFASLQQTAVSVIGPTANVYFNDSSIEIAANGHDSSMTCNSSGELAISTGVRVIANGSGYGLPNDDGSVTKKIILSHDGTTLVLV